MSPNLFVVDTQLFGYVRQDTGGGQGQIEGIFRLFERDREAAAAKQPEPFRELGRPAPFAF